VKRCGDIVEGGDRLRSGVQDGAPEINEPGAQGQDIAPLAVIGATPNGGELGHGAGDVGVFARIHADGMIEEIGVLHQANPGAGV
jgi:hypothetical protein